jgi:hypothetical protein
MKLSPIIFLVCFANIFCIGLLLLQAFWPFTEYVYTNTLFDSIGIANGLLMVFNYLFLAYLLFYFKENNALSILFAMLAILNSMSFLFTPNLENFRILGAFGVISFLLTIVILVLSFHVNLERIRFSILLIPIAMISIGVINMLFPFVIGVVFETVDVRQADMVIQLFISIGLRLSFVLSFIKLKQAL